MPLRVRGLYPGVASFREVAMKPLKRSPVRKSASAAKFRGHTARTKAANMSVNPMRGGWRL